MLHNDDGIKLAETQREMPPVQRMAYLFAKKHHGADGNDVSSNTNPKHYV